MGKRKYFASLAPKPLPEFSRDNPTKAKPARAKALLAKGNTHDEIAKSIGVSRRTVIRYLQG